MDDLELDAESGPSADPTVDSPGSDYQTAEQPIYGGVDTDFDAVVRVGGCSGTFIAPHFIITAQHCLPSCSQYPSSSPPLNMYACYDGSAGPPWHVGSRSGIVAGKTARGGLFADAGPTYHIDFGYVPNDTTFTPWPYGSPDVAILHTVEPFAGVPINVMGPNRIFQAANIVSYEHTLTQINMVGYSPNAGHDDSRRRWGIGWLSGHDSYGRAFQVDGSASGSVVCPGDSGGPALLYSDRADEEQVAGVISVGPNCNPGQTTNPPSSYFSTFAYIPHDFVSNVVCGDGWEYLGSHPENLAAAAHTALVRLSDEGVVCRASQGAASSGRVVLIRNDARHEILEYDDTAEAWWLIDDNPASREIAVSAGYVYQRHANGHVFGWNGGFRSWTQLDYTIDPQRRLAVDDQFLYEIDGDGSIWKYHNGGWFPLDRNPASTRIDAGDFGLVQMHGGTGAIWRYDPLSNTWGLLIQSSAIVDFAVGDVLTLLLNDGSVLRFDGSWSFLGADTTIGSLVVREGEIYRMHDTGSQAGNVFRYVPSAFGWLNLGGRGYGAEAIFGSVGR